MKRMFFCLTASLFAVLTCFGQDVKVGETLPLWQEGELDIHLISTGRGESTFLIFPDGTTFLNDASGAMSEATSSVEPHQLGKADPKPNADITSGRVIIDYINHFSPAVSKGHVNYFLLTHHHGDHMGELTDEIPFHENGIFRLTSLCEIGSSLILDNLFDRDWPDFSFPKAAKGAMMDNYRAFLDWTARENGSKVEKWAVGSSVQVVPLHDKSYGLTIRNLAGNGCCATEEEGGYYSFMPSKSEFDVMEKGGFPSENCFSCAYMLSYGKFDFFLGGDLQYPGRDKYPYKDAETPLTNVVRKVEVMEADHHGYRCTHPTEFINKLAPDVWIVGVWTGIRQPDQDATRRVIKANPDCDIFCTYQSETNFGRLVEELGQEKVERHMVSHYGHIVVRVAPGGDSYMVYTLEDSDQEYVVKSVHGPYICGD